MQDAQGMWEKLAIGTVKLAKFRSKITELKLYKIYIYFFFLKKKSTTVY